MSALEPKIFAALIGAADVAALVATRVYPSRAPQGCDLPCIVYSRVSGGQNNNLAGYSGSERPRIQVDIFSTDYDQARDLGKKIRTAMEAATAFNALTISDMDEWDDDPEVYRVTIDFSVWHKED